MANLPVWGLTVPRIRTEGLCRQGITAMGGEGGPQCIVPKRRAWPQNHNQRLPLPLEMPNSARVCSQEPLGLSRAGRLAQTSPGLLASRCKFLTEHSCPRPLRDAHETQAALLRSEGPGLVLERVWRSPWEGT